jgi:hypothetical protein
MIGTELVLSGSISLISPQHRLWLLPYLQVDDGCPDNR